MDTMPQVIQVFLAQTQTPEAPPPDLGFMSAILHAGFVEQVTMALLALFSVVSWGIIAFKWKTLRQAFQQSETFLDLFWESKQLDSIFKKSETLSASPVSQVFRSGYIELAKIKKKAKSDEADTELGSLESVERSMRRAQSAELTALESLVPFLATVASASPFIGLFGTVVGIMSAFQAIGAMGNASLATVAPAIGGALVATAFGLFAAIPAVIAYNYLQSKTHILDTEMQNFSADFLNIIKRHFF